MDGRSLRLCSLAGLALLAILASVLLRVGPTPPVHAAAGSAQDSTLTLPDGSRHTLHLAPGLRISLFATGLPSARFLALGPRGDIFVGSTSAGTLSVVVHRHSATHAERVVTL